MNGMLVLYNNSRPTQKPNPKQSRYVSRFTSQMRSAFADPAGTNFPRPENNLSGILDLIKEYTAPYVAAGAAKIRSTYQDQIDSAQRKLEAKVGEFLTTSQTLSEIKNRAQAQMNSQKKEVSDRAVAISAKATALMNNYTAIKGTALGLGTTLSALRTQLNSDPLFKIENPMSMGTRIVELFNNYKNSLAQAVTGSVQVIARMDNQISETKKLQNDVESLESYAQGKGWSATLDAVGGSAVTNLLSPAVKIVTIGALVYFLAPSLLGRVLAKR